VSDGSDPGWRGFTLVAAFTVALALAFHPEVLGVGGTWKLPGWDATRVFWADLVFMRRSALAGELPLWNPYDRGGYAFAAEPQSGVFDPITWIVVGVGIALGSAPAWLISLKALLYYVLGATGVYAFVTHRARVRGLTLPPWGIALGVMVYVVGGRMDKLKDQSGLWPSAWAPWLLLAVAWAVQRPDARRGVVLGLVGGLTVLSGYPPVAVRLVVVLLAPMAVFWAVQALRALEAGEPRRRYAAKLGVMVGVALAVFGGLVAAQLVATLQVLPMTKRTELGLDQVLASQVQLRHGLGLFAPGAAKVSVLLYAGVGCGVLGLASVVVRRDAERGLLFGLGVFAFLLACGDNAPVLPWLAELPGFRSFRIAGHFIVVSAVVAAVLVPFGAAALEGARRDDDPSTRDDGPGRRAIEVGVCAGLGVMIFFRFAHAPSWLACVAVVASGGLLVAIPLLCGRVVSGTTLAVSAVLGWCVVACVGVDVYYGNRTVARILQPLPDETRPAVLAAAVEDPAHHRMADFSWARNRPGTRTGVRDLVGARPAMTDRLYMDVYRQAQRSSGTLRAMGVSRAAFGMPAPVRSQLRRDRSAEGLAAAVRLVPHPWPRAFLVSSFELAEDEAAALASLSRGEPRAIAFGEDARALATSGLPSRGPNEVVGGVVPAAVKLPVTAPVHGRVEVRLPERTEPGVVVLNEAWDPGWRAYVDGAPAPVLRVNMLHRAVVVPAGAHEVEFDYAPPGVRALWWLWLMTLVAATVVSVLTLRAASSSG